jgi:transaldolase
VCVTTRLERLYTEQRQSPWLDNLTRPYLRDGKWLPS